jgi:WD40 repeat protein
MVNHQKILGWIHVGLGGGSFLIGLAIFAGVLLEKPYSSNTAAFVAGLLSWFSVAIFLPSLAAGIGLFKGKRWARFLMIGISVEFLFAPPLGTALGAYGLWTLLSKQPDTQTQGAELPAQRSHIDPSRKGVLLALASVAAAFITVLGAGFLLSRQHVRVAPMNYAFGVIAALAIGALALTIASLLGVPIGKRSLLARRSPIAPQIDRAPATSVSQLSEAAKAAYANNPELTMTCPHLQPLERAMRAAGIAVVPTYRSVVRAACRIHRRALQRTFPLGETVIYREFFEAERHIEDIPIARVQCTPCLSWIEVLHPYESNRQTQWFPTAPEPLTLITEHTAPSHSAVTVIACSPTGRLAAIASGIYNDPTDFLVWDTEHCKPVLQLPAHGVIRSIAWTADEKILVTGRGILWTQGQGSPGESIFVWDAQTGKELHRFGADLFGVRGIAISADGRTLLASGMLGKTAAEGSTLDLWDLHSGKLLMRLARVDMLPSETLPFFSSVALTPDGSLAIAACDRYTLPVPLRQRGNANLPPWWYRGVRAWKLPGAQEVDLIPQAGPVRTISLSQDGTKLFFSGMRFGVWSLTTRSMLWDKINGYDTGFAASPDCKLIARGTGYKEDNHGPYVDAGVELYDGSTGELLSYGDHRTPPAALAFSSATKLVSGGSEGDLRFWRWTPE